MHRATDWYHIFQTNSIRFYPSCCMSARLAGVLYRPRPAAAGYFFLLSMISQVLSFWHLMVASR